MKSKVCPESKLIADLFFPSMSMFSRVAAKVNMLPEGFTPQQIKVIMELSISDSLRLSDLSKCACVTQGTMTVAVQKLLKKGLLVKKADPDDERAIRLGLSVKGKAVAADTKQRMTELFDFICQNLSAKDRKKLAESYQFLFKTYQTIATQKGV